MDTVSFIIESNAIEGVWQQSDDVLAEQVKATDIFIELEEITVEALEMLARSYDKTSALATDKEDIIAHLLREVESQEIRPFEVHRTFMGVNPFTACNGMVGRTLWLWQMKKLNKPIKAGFLQEFYRQALE